MILNLKIFCLHEPLNSVFQRYFFVFCVVEEIFLVVHGNDANLRIIIFYVVICYYFVTSNWVAQIFYCCFSSYLRVYR